MKQTFSFCLCILSFFSLSAPLFSDVRTEWLAMMEGRNTKDFSDCSSIRVPPTPPVHHPYAPFFPEKVGFILLAGGQGSRLGSDIPKGMVPIPPSGKTLFEIFLRRMVGFYESYHTWPFCAIMTSDETDRETRRYIQEHHFFGVPEDHVFFFCQTSLPLLNQNGEQFSEHGELVTGPDGNGKVFTCFCERGLWNIWKERGVSFVSVMPIDNPLMDPYLPSLFHPVIEHMSQASFATLPRRSKSEKVGVFIQKNQKLHVVEYSEIPEIVRDSTDASGTLVYPWANISVLCLSMDSIQSLSGISLPIHFAKKMKESMPIYKAEYFIFDNFPSLSSFTLVPLDRSRYFSPIKNKTGEDSLDQASLDFRKVQREQAQRVGISLSETEDPSSIDPALLYLGN